MEFNYLNIFYDNEILYNEKPDRNTKSTLVKYLENTKTSHCNVTIAKGTFGMSVATWAISKNNPDFEAFQRGYKSNNF